MGVSVSKLAFPVERAGAVVPVPGLGLGHLAPARLGLSAPAPVLSGSRASARGSHCGRNYRNSGNWRRLRHARERQLENRHSHSRSKLQRYPILLREWPLRRLGEDHRVPPGTSNTAIPKIWTPRRGLCGSADLGPGARRVCRDVDEPFKSRQRDGGEEFLALLTDEADDLAPYRSA